MAELTFKSAGVSSREIDLSQPRVTGPTGAFSISGITKPDNPDGRVVILYNTTSQNMTITNDATSTAANRILTNTGSDVATTGTGIVSLIYSVTDARWILLTKLD